MKNIVKLRQSFVFKKILYIGIVLSTLLYVFFIPSFGERTSALSFIVYASMILLGTLVFVFNIIYQDFRIHNSMLLILFFALFSLIGTALYSHDFRRWVSIFLLSVSFFIFVYAFKIIKSRYLVVSIIAIAFFFFSIYFIWHYKQDFLNFKSFISGSFRLGSFFDNPNGVAAYSVVGFASSLYCVLFGKNKTRFLFIIAILTSGLVGISTGSRSFIFACLLFVVVFLFFVFKKHKLIYILSLIIFIGLFIAFLNLPFLETIKTRIWDAFLTIFGKADKPDTATMERTIWFDYGLFLGFKNGLFGYGANGFSIYSGVGTYTHSNISEVLCNFGFIGFILFYLPLIIAIIVAAIKKNIDKPLVISFALYYIFIGISNVFYYKKVYYLVLALCFYVIYFENISKRKIFGLKQIKSVVFTCDSLTSGGAEKVITTLANEFTLYNITVTIVGISDIGIDKPFYYLKEDVGYIPLCFMNQKLPSFLKRAHILRKQINKLQPDVVISFLPHVNVYTTCALIGKKSICHIVSERNNPITDPKGLFRKLAKRISFNLADGCVFQTTAAKNAYSDTIQNKSVVIMNPLNISNVSLQNRAVNNTFVNVGRLVPQKNQELLIESFNEFNKVNGYRYFLKIYGNGPLKEKLLKKCIRNIAICEPDVNWLDNEKNDRCFILSSNYEGLPNTLAEALSIGLSCISSDCDIGGPRELYNKGFVFELFKNGDKGDLISCFNKIINQQCPFHEENIVLAKKMNASVITRDWILFINSL